MFFLSGIVKVSSFSLFSPLSIYLFINFGGMKDALEEEGFYFLEKFVYSQDGLPTETFRLEVFSGIPMEERTFCFGW